MKTKTKTIKKTMPSKEVLINFVLDESGSMETCRDATISGFNEYIESLKKIKEKVLFSLVKFDSTKIESVHILEDIKKIVPLTRDTYIPGQLTPLYDAIAKTIKEVEAKTAKKKNQKTLITVMTDGQENDSKEYTREKIFNLIKEKEKAGWTFIYLGANQDAWEVGQSIGLHKGNVMAYSVAQTKETFNNIASRTVAYAIDNTNQTFDFFKPTGGKVNGTNHN